MYRSVNELSETEFEELREAYYWNEENDYDLVDEIPDHVIIDFYDGISFTEDDFFCNQEVKD